MLLRDYLTLIIIKKAGNIFLHMLIYTLLAALVIFDLIYV